MSEPTPTTVAFVGGEGNASSEGLGSDLRLFWLNDHDGIKLKLSRLGQRHWLTG
jgi:hypothetical protein